ncbi:hypothetical protein JNK62_00530 [bacterium]|nr:hypothetical protein [bacterium]
MLQSGDTSHATNRLDAVFQAVYSKNRQVILATTEEGTPTGRIGPSEELRSGIEQMPLLLF